MILYTIGFSKKSLQEFIEILITAKIKTVIDIRLHNTSQLAGYAKKADLEYVLDLVGIEYEHIPALAPTEELLKGLKKKEITWVAYEKDFLEQLSARDLSKILDTAIKAGPICLLCSENQPLHCHRRLVADCYARLHPEMIVKHL